MIILRPVAFCNRLLRAAIRSTFSSAIAVAVIFLYYWYDGGTFSVHLEYSCNWNDCFWKLLNVNTRPRWLSLSYYPVMCGQVIQNNAITLQEHSPSWKPETYDLTVGSWQIFLYFHFGVEFVSLWQIHSERLPAGTIHLPIKLPTAKLLATKFSNYSWVLVFG